MRAALLGVPVRAHAFDDKLVAGACSGWARPMKSYVFRVELVEEEDDRWSAGVPALPGCATWGETKEQALRHLHDALEA